MEAVSSSAGNLFCLQTELVELAAGLDMLDAGKLREGNRS